MKRFVLSLLLLFFLLYSLSGCGRTAYSETTFFAMDTLITVRLSPVGKNGETLAEDYLRDVHTACRKIVTDLENTLSVTVPDSDTARLNASETGIEDASAAFTDLLTRSLQISSETDGAFTPTLRPVSDLWNIAGGGYVPTFSEIAEILPRTDISGLSVHGPSVKKADGRLSVDFGGIGKGYAAAALIDYLNETDVSGGLVSLGGNVGLFGEKADGVPYKIGITDPKNTSAVAGYLHLTDGFVSVSGDYERYFEKNGVRYHHILDPETGMPAETGLSSVAVISPDGTLADALSTALFVMGADKAFAFYESGAYEFEAVFITKDDTVLLTEGIAERFEHANPLYTPVQKQP